MARSARSHSSVLRNIAHTPEYRRAALPPIELEPQAEENVDFDTFCKSDFRVVKVKSCEDVYKRQGERGIILISY